MQELSAIELAGKLSEMRVVQKNEREAKQGIKYAGKDEKSAIKKARDAKKTETRRKLEEALEDKEYGKYAENEL